MKKYISLCLGLFLLFGNYAVSDLINTDYSGYISLVFVIAGAVLICIFLLDRLNEKEQKDNDRFEGISHLVSDIEKSVQDHHTEELILEQLVAISGCLQHFEKEILERIDLKNQEIARHFSELEQEIDQQFSITGKMITQKVDEQKLKYEEMEQTFDRSMHELLNQMNLSNQHLEKNNDVIKQLEVEVSQLDRIPRELYEIADELAGKMSEKLGEEEKLLKGLCYCIEDENKNLVNRLNKSMGEIVESLDDYAGDMRENMEQIAQQYAEFQKITDSVIQQLTLMSDQDYEIMKGLLNDQGR